MRGPRDPDSEAESPLEPKRGRLSREHRQRIFDLYAAGHSYDEIAEILQRTTGLIKKTLEEPARRQHPRGTPEPPARDGDESAEPGTLRHAFWLRPETKIELELPVDLREDEVERLADFLKTLWFRPS